MRQTEAYGIASPSRLCRKPDYPLQLESILQPHEQLHTLRVANFVSQNAFLVPARFTDHYHTDSARWR